jgi:hypothetical protein
MADTAHANTPKKSTFRRIAKYAIEKHTAQVMAANAPAIVDTNARVVKKMASGITTPPKNDGVANPLSIRDSQAGIHASDGGDSIVTLDGNASLRDYGGLSPPQSRFRIACGDSDHSFAGADCRRHNRASESHAAIRIIPLPGRTVAATIALPNRMRRFGSFLCRGGLSPPQSRFRIACGDSDHSFAGAD